MSSKGATCRRVLFATRSLIPSAMWLTPWASVLPQPVLTSAFQWVASERSSPVVTPSAGGLMRSALADIERRKGRRVRKEGVKRLDLILTKGSIENSQL